MPGPKVAADDFTGPKGRAWLINEQGSHKDMKLVTIEAPAPAAGQVRVKVTAACTNPVDYKRCTWPTQLVAYPAVVGIDGAGVVDAIGEGVSTHKVGDRVQIFVPISSGWGTFTEFCLVDADHAFNIPDEVTFAQAAAIPTAAYTAYYGLFSKLNIQAGKTLFVTGGAGGVGSFAIQLAKNAGVKVVTTCSTANVDALKKLGADLVVDYTKEKVADAVKAFAGESGIDYVFDCVGGDALAEAASTLGVHGQVAGIVGDIPTDFSMFLRAISVHHVLILAAPASELDTMAKEIFKQIVAGKLQVEITKTLALDDVIGQLDQHASGRARGKYIVEIAKA